MVGCLVLASARTGVNVNRCAPPHPAPPRRDQPLWHPPRGSNLKVNGRGGVSRSLPALSAPRWRTRGCAQCLAARTVPQPLWVLQEPHAADARGAHLGEQREHDARLQQRQVLPQAVARALNERQERVRVVRLLRKQKPRGVELGGLLPHVRAHVHPLDADDDGGAGGHLRAAPAPSQLGCNSPRRGGTVMCLVRIGRIRFRVGDELTPVPNPIPLHDCSPYRGLHARREHVGVVPCAKG
jgi:hypothetical protein